MNNRIPFQKPYTSAHDLVCLLQSRGLTVTDTAKAESYLEYIGYYRLSAYMYPLLQIPKEQHRYKPNTTFSQVIYWMEERTVVAMQSLMYYLLHLCLAGFVIPLPVPHNPRKGRKITGRWWSEAKPL